MIPKQKPQKSSFYFRLICTYSSRPWQRRLKILLKWSSRRGGLFYTEYYYNLSCTNRRRLYPLFLVQYGERERWISFDDANYRGLVWPSFFWKILTALDFEFFLLVWSKFIIFRFILMRVISKFKKILNIKNH